MVLGLSSVYDKVQEAEVWPRHSAVCVHLFFNLVLLQPLWQVIPTFFSYLVVL